MTPAALAMAATVRSEVTASLERMLNTVDCLVCPSMANAARVKEAESVRPRDRRIVEASGQE